MGTASAWALNALRWGNLRISTEIAAISRKPYKIGSDGQKLTKKLLTKSLTNFFIIFCITKPKKNS